MDWFEDSENSHRIHGSQQWRKDKRIEQKKGRVQILESTALVNTPQGETKEQGIEEGTEDSVQQDGAQLVEERPGRHEVARIEDYWRQDDEKEESGVQLVSFLVGEVQEDTKNDTDDDKETALREIPRQILLPMKD